MPGWAGCQRASGRPEPGGGENGGSGDGAGALQVVDPLGNRRGPAPVVGQYNPQDRGRAGVSSANSTTPVAPAQAGAQPHVRPALEDGSRRYRGVGPGLRRDDELKVSG